MISSALPISRVVHAPTLLPNPVTFKFDPNTPEAEQDSVIKSHMAGIQANRNVDRVGPAGALGILLGQAQNALIDRPQSDGPRLIRSGPVWGMTQESTDNMFNQVVQNNQRAAEMEMQRKENLARRSMLLDQMEEERAMKDREIKLNMALKQMEHDTALETEKRKAELQSKRDETLHANKMELEAKKAELKPPKLVSAYDAKTGTYTLQPEAEGLVTKGPKSEAEMNKSAFDYATHLMDFEFVDEATGQSIPMDFATATQAAQALAAGEPVHWDIPGVKLIDKKQQDLVPITDETGTTKLGPKAEGTVTKVPEKPSPREIQQTMRTMWDVSKDSLKDAQAELDALPQTAEDDGYNADALKAAKEAVAFAKQQEVDARKALMEHLKTATGATEDVGSASPSPATPTPVGSPVPRKLKDGTTVTVQQMSDGTYQEVK